MCENRVPTGADDTAILPVWNGPETYLLPDKDPPRGTKATGAKLCTTTVADTRISREIFILTEEKQQSHFLGPGKDCTQARTDGTKEGCYFSGLSLFSVKAGTTTRGVWEERKRDQTVQKSHPTLPGTRKKIRSTVLGTSTCERLLRLSLDTRNMRESGAMIDSAGNPPPSFVAKPFPYKTLPGIPNAQSPPERDPVTKPCDCSVTVSRTGQGAPNSFRRWSRGPATRDHHICLLMDGWMDKRSECDNNDDERKATTGGAASVPTSPTGHQQP